MNSTDPMLFVVLSAVILTGLVVIFYFVNTHVSGRWNKHKAETVDQWAADDIEFIQGPSGGQFGGFESMGQKQALTGVGFVALSTKDLRVTRANPSAEWRFTFRQIKGVTLQSTFLGKKSKKTPFIVIRFKQDGKADKLGFQVNDYETWAGILAEKAKVSLKDRRAS